MIRFGLRLTLRGGREAIARLVVICAAVAIGVGLLLSTLAGISAVHHQNDRYAWLDTSAAGSHTQRHAVAGVDPVWWMLTGDEFHGTEIGRVDVAKTGPHSPVPPGLTRLPDPGQYYASPALAADLRRYPAAELADRYPGRLSGTIGDAGLPSPDALVVVVGRPVAAISANPNAELVSTISTTPPDQCNNACYDIGLNDHSIDLILGVVTAAILFPIMIFIGTATRLSAARRDQRFAALRLVGGTPRQIAVVSTVESTLATMIGTAFGFLLFALFRPVMAAIPFTGTRFFTADLTLTNLDIILTIIGVPLAAAVAARIALRRVIISPLGVTRRVTPKHPQAWRLLVPLAGIGELTYFVIQGRPASTGGQTLAFASAVILTMIGLVVAGPWLTMTGSRLLARRANRPASLVAARRLGDNPHGGFRAISGLVVSLYVATVALGISISLGFGFGFGRGQADANTPAGRSTVVADLTGFAGGAPTVPVKAVPTTMVAAIDQIAGVAGAVVLHAPPSFLQSFGPPPSTNQLGAAPAGNPGPPQVVAACSQLTKALVLGRCAPGAVTALVPDISFVGGPSSYRKHIWPASTYTLASLNSLPVPTVVVATNGPASAIESSRTLLERSLPSRFEGGFAPLTVRENQDQGDNARRAAGYQRLADIVILTSLPIAGCTLAVSIIGGINDRRRAFSLLRLAGTPLSTLRRVIAYEAAVPLLISSITAIGIGFLTAYLFLRAQLDDPLTAPGLSYYLCVAAGLLASLAIIATTFPVLRRTTGPEAARND